MNADKYKKCLEQALELFNKGDYRKTADELTGLLNDSETLDTDSESSLIYLRGLCFKNSHKNREAGMDMKRVLLLYPGWLDPLLEYGYICSLTGADSEAEKSLRAVINTDPASYEEDSLEHIESLIIRAKAYLGGLYVDQDKPGKAKRLLAEYDF